MHRTSLLFILIAVLLSGCQKTTRMVGSGKAPKSGMISKVELRDKLDRFEDFFVANLKQTAEDINTAGGTRRVARTNIQMQSRCLEAVHAMTASDDSIIAFLDTWGLMVRLRIYFTEGPGKSTFGEQQDLAVGFIEACEEDIERIAQLFLSPEQFEETQRNVVIFARQYPIQGNFSNLVVYATKIKKAEVGMFMKTISIPMAPIRAMEGVDKTGDAILKVRDSVERFTDVAEQIPESTRWQMSILMDDFEESEMTQAFLERLSEFSESSNRLVDTLNAMPVQMRQELVTLLEESEQGQQQLQTTMQATAKTAEQAAQAAAEWKNAFDSFQEVVKLFKSDTPRPPDAPPAFGMRDFDTMLINAGQTADKVNQAIDRLQTTIDSDTTNEIQKELNSVIDHAAWRLFQLIVAIFVLTLAGGVLKRKLTAK